MQNYDERTRDRDNRYAMRDRDGDFDRRDDRRSAFFGSDNDRDFDRDRNRGWDNDRDRQSGWGGLMPRNENRDREFDRDRDRNRRFDRDSEFGSDAYHKGIPMDETRRLIASNKVEETPVYGRDGDRLGSIHNFMVDKRSGKVVYAVLKSSAGFLGLGERYYPLNWDELTYNTKVDGYCVDILEDELDERRSFDNRGREHRSERRDRRDRW